MPVELPARCEPSSRICCGHFTVTVLVRFVGTLVPPIGHEYVRRFPVSPDPGTVMRSDEVIRFSPSFTVQLVGSERSSETLTSMLSAFGFVTVMCPVTLMSLFVPALCVAVTVYENVALEPAVWSTRVLSTLLARSH